MYLWRSVDGNRNQAKIVSYMRLGVKCKLIFSQNNKKLICFGNSHLACVCLCVMRVIRFFGNLWLTVLTASKHTHPHDD